MGPIAPAGRQVATAGDRRSRDTNSFSPQSTDQIDDVWPPVAEGGLTPNRAVRAIRSQNPEPHMPIVTCHRDLSRPGTRRRPTQPEAIILSRPAEADNTIQLPASPNISVPCRRPSQTTGSPASSRLPRTRSRCRSRKSCSTRPPGDFATARAASRAVDGGSRRITSCSGQCRRNPSTSTSTRVERSPDGIDMSAPGGTVHSFGASTRSISRANDSPAPLMATTTSGSTRISASQRCSRRVADTHSADRKITAGSDPAEARGTAARDRRSSR